MRWDVWAEMIEIVISMRSKLQLQKKKKDRCRRCLYSYTLFPLRSNMCLLLMMIACSIPNCNVISTYWNWFVRIQVQNGKNSCLLWYSQPTAGVKRMFTPLLHQHLSINLTLLHWSFYKWHVFFISLLCSYQPLLIYEVVNEKLHNNGLSLQ